MATHTATQPSLRATFAERAISTRTMPGRLRAVLAVAVLEIAGAAVLVALRDSRLASVPLDAVGGEQATMPSLSFWLTVVFLSAAWGYLLAGLLHAHRLVRIGGLALFTWAVYELWNVPFPLADVRMAPSYVVLAAIWALGLGLLRVDGERLRLRLPALLFTLVLALYLAFWWRLRPFGDPRFYTLAVFHQLQLASFALIPVLFVAGVDFAEWGDVAASRLAGLAGRLRHAAALPLVAAASAAGVLAYVLATANLSHLARGLGVAAAFAVLVGVCVPALRGGHRHVPYAALFAAALVFVGMLLGIAYSVSAAPASAGESMLTLRQAAPRFEVRYPLSWQVSRLPEKGGIAIYLLRAPERAAQLYVVYLPPAIARGVADPRGAIFKGTVTATRRDGPWLEQRFDAIHGNEGIAWQRSVGGATWLVAGVAGRHAFAELEPVFREVEASWTTKPRARAAESAPANGVTDAERAITDAALAWLGIAVAAGGLLVGLRRRSPPSWLGPSLVFLVVAGLYFGLVELPTVGFTLFGATSWPQLTVVDLEVLCAGATLLALATRRGRRAAPQLAVLNLGLLAIYWLGRALSGGIDAGGRFSLVQAVLVLAALVWDIVMSGEAITNRHNRHFPRHTRVLVYLGYVMAVAAAVLFFSSFHVPSGSSLEPNFESEGYAQDGLLFLGTSLVLTLFLLRTARLRRDESPSS